ncbi:hypothetical protein PPYR_04225 [Photinus pyralis]|uniref:26S proteasome non-ATPase regulatory subunit 5 n=3 Tax=Photinus pyralis TaxID=7054 RepID=A0A5N4AXH1_PHOPY|nr:26S proteasome non-ATPase regulatory subunit 5 isoform X2 [Photinus pyralis]XP_031333466.1 26S proteasome non-ATPase regulatory subunit 5 isoform X2 [Photinus pyralis]XP_031333467.1 26S proteasome non-ATPase regulatory subunit 5 isoform X2 [Photinus pyralis]KAB0802039.1 hypothetical protein PPYR_04225 [Photinus pyralis]
MANHKEWCSQQTVNLLQEELRIPTLNEIKDYLASLTSEEAKQTINDFPLTYIFDCLNNTNVEQIELANEVLTLCMSHLSIGETLNRYSISIERALRHPHSSVKTMGLNEILRNLQSEDQVNSLGRQTTLVKCIFECIADNDLAVAKVALEIIYKLAVSRNCLQIILSQEILQNIHRLRATNEIVRLRFNELFVNVSVSSESSMQILDSHGLLSIILEDLDTDDILLMMNIIQLLSQLVMTKHGYAYLEVHGITSKILSKLECEDSIPLLLCEPGVLKFFGAMAYRKPEQILVKYAHIIHRIFSIIEETNSTLIGVALDTLGYIGETNEGKFSLDSIENKIPETIKVIYHNIQTYPTEIKIRALNCLENLFRICEFDSKITNLVRKWYCSVDGNLMTLIYDFAKNPFNEIRFAAFRVLDALSSHNWGQEIFRNTPGFIEFLLDRRSENFKDCKEAKYNIIRVLSLSSVFDHSTQTRLQEYVSEGPFYVQAVTEVAIEGD